MMEDSQTYLVPHSTISPSYLNGVSEERERRYRSWGCELIQEGCILLHAPQVVAATACNCLHRFYFRVSLRRYDVFPLAMACVFIGSKVEECPRRMKDVINTFNHIYQKRKKVKIMPIDSNSDRYIRWSLNMIELEREILAGLGYGIYSVIEHPHKFVFYYIRYLEGTPGIYDDLAQLSWNILNDSLRLPACVQYSSNVMSCAAIYLGARMLDIVLPTSPPWWDLYDAPLSDMVEVAIQVLDLYSLLGRETSSWLPSLKSNYIDEDEREDIPLPLHDEGEEENGH